MYFLYYCFFCSFFLGLLLFDKKLIFLLSLETMMIFLISIFFFFSLKNLGNFSFTNSMLFLVFMVLDSVLGISLLISSSRSYSEFSPYSSFF